MRPTADPFARVYRTDDHNEPAPLVADPFFQKLDLRGVERLPVRVEPHDAIVVVHLVARGGEVVEDGIGLLRDAGPGRLQQHVDRARWVAKELIAKEVVFAHRSAGQQQDAILAADRLDVGLALVVGRISVAR